MDSYVFPFGLRARIPAFGESSKDGEDTEEYEDKTPFESKKSNVPLEMTTVLNLMTSWKAWTLWSLTMILHKMRMGDPSADVTKENHEAAQLSKVKAMEAIADGKFEAIGYLYI